MGPFGSVGTRRGDAAVGAGRRPGLLPPAGGAYVPTVFVGMYATLGMSMPSLHFVDTQDRTVIPEIEPPTRPRPVAWVLDRASFHGIVVRVIQFLIALLRSPDVHVVEPPFRIRDSQFIIQFIIALALQPLFNDSMIQ